MEWYSDLPSIKKENAHTIREKIRQTKTMDFQHNPLLIYGHFLAQDILASLSNSFSPALLGVFAAALSAIFQTPSLDIPAFRAQILGMDDSRLHGSPFFVTSPVGIFLMKIPLGSSETSTKPPTSQPYFWANLFPPIRRQGMSVDSRPGW